MQDHLLLEIKKEKSLIIKCNITHNIDIIHFVKNVVN